MLNKGKAVNPNEIRVCQMKEMECVYVYVCIYRSHVLNIFLAAVSLNLLVKGRHSASYLLDSTSLYMLISKVTYMLIYYLLVI